MNDFFVFAAHLPGSAAAAGAGRMAPVGGGRIARAPMLQGRHRPSVSSLVPSPLNGGKAERRARVRERYESFLDKRARAAPLRSFQI